MKKLPYTPNSRIKSALRKLWLRSRERAATLKRDDYTCQLCGKKQSRRKGHCVYVEVHHKSGITNWDEIYGQLRRHLLVDPSELITLCKKCHNEEAE